MYKNTRTAVIVTILAAACMLSVSRILGCQHPESPRADTSAVPPERLAPVHTDNGDSEAWQAGQEGLAGASERKAVSNGSIVSADSASIEKYGLRVRAMKAGVPVPAVEILVGSRNGANGLSLSEWEASLNEDVWLQSSGTDGYSVFSAVPTRTPLLIASRTDGSRWVAEAQEFVVIEGRWTEHVIDVAPGGVVVGRVIDDAGFPLGGHDLILAPNPGARDRYLTVAEPLSVTTYSDSLGNFRFTGLPVGQWIVGCKNHWSESSDAWRDAPASFGRAFSISEAQPQVQLTLRVSCGLLIEGTLEFHGRAVEDAVWVSAIDGEGHGFGATSANGRFSIGPLQAGEYSLQAVGNALCRYRDSETIRVSAGRRDIVLSLAVGVDVVVVPIPSAAAGASESMQVLVAAPISGRSNFVPRIISGVADRFLVSGLPEGPVDIAVRSSLNRIGVVQNVHLTRGLLSPLEVPVKLSQASKLNVDNASKKWVEFEVRSDGSLVEHGWACPQTVTEIWIPQGAYVLETATEGVRVRNGSQRAALGQSTSVSVEDSH